MTALPTRPRATGWNSWDVRHHTGYVHLPCGLRLRFALMDGDGTTEDGFTWRHGLVGLGHHTVDGSYAQVSVTAFDTRLDIEFAPEGDVLYAVATTTGAASPMVVIDQAPGFGDGAGAAFEPISPDGAQDVAVSVGGRRWNLALSPTARDRGPGNGSLDGNTLRLLGARNAVQSLCLAPTEATTVSAVGDRVAVVRDSTLGERLRTSGWLGSAGDAHVRSVVWNTVYAPDLGRVLTPTSRDFVCAEREGFYGTWALHTWDSFFTGLVAGWVDPSYARGVFGQIIDQADESGMLPNRVSDDRGRTDDRSQPPIGALTVLKAYLGSGLSEPTRERALADDAWPALHRWHTWWPRARRGPLGLLAWGSDPVRADADSATVDRTRRESGLDDSPMYDSVSYNPSTHTMDLADVGLNALHIADAEALAVLAEIRGDSRSATELRQRADTARDTVNRLLWDAEHGEYRNRWEAGGFSPAVSPTLLYPLLAGVPTPEQARQMVDRLLSPEVLGGEPPLPSAARDDPGFSTRYWRGRVWAPMVFLAVEGLRRYGFDREAGRIVDSLLGLFLDEWERHGHVRENYPVLPGEDVRALEARSDGLMSWGSLLAYLAYQELADPRVTGWRFAHPGRPASLMGLPLGEGRLSVQAARRLAVHLDDTPLLDNDPHVVVSAYTRDRDRVCGVVTAKGTTGRARVAPPDGEAVRVFLTVSGEEGEESVRTHTGTELVEIAAEPGAPVAFRLTAEHTHAHAHEQESM